MFYLFLTNQFPRSMEEIEEDLNFFYMHIYAYIKVYIFKIIVELVLIHLNYLLMFRYG
jgi:hypothetical protein